MAKYYQVKVYYPEVYDTWEVELSDKEYAEYREAVDKARKELLEEYPDEETDEKGWNQWLEETITQEYDFKVVFWNGFINKEAKVLWIDLDHPIEKMRPTTLKIREVMDEVLDDEYDPSGERNKSLLVKNLSSEYLDKCIREAIAEPIDNNMFQLITIDANDFAQGKLPTNLPVVREGSSYSQEYEEKNPPVDKIEDYGYGILFIRNITKNNYEKFPRNLTYSITKNHSIGRYLISPHWLMVLGVPSEDFHMDLALGHYILIDGNNL